MTKLPTRTLKPAADGDRPGWAAAWCQGIRQVQSEAIDVGIATVQLLTSPRAWMELARLGTRQWVLGASGTWEECRQLALAHGCTAQTLLHQKGWLYPGVLQRCQEETALRLAQAAEAGLRANTLAALRFQARAARFWSLAWDLIEPGTRAGNGGRVAEHLNGGTKVSAVQARLSKRTNSP